MLVLSRRVGESFFICGTEIKITVVEVDRGKVRIGIEADRDKYPVWREELSRPAPTDGTGDHPKG
jgi:carbon storage regulator